MRSRLRGAGAGQSAVKGTRGGGAAAGPRGAFPHHGQAPARSSQPLGSRWVQVGCAFGGGALRRASCGQHPVSVGMGGPQARGREGWAALAAATHLQGPPAEAEVPGPEGDPGPTSHLRGHSQEWGPPWHDWCSRAHHRRQPTTAQPWDCGALRSAASRRPGPAYCTHSPKRPVEPPLPQPPRPFPEAHPTLHARKRCSRTSGWDTAACVSTQGAPAAGHGASTRLALES